MSDIVERLRRETRWHGHALTKQLIGEAADTIEQLRKEAQAEEVFTASRLKQIAVLQAESDDRMMGIVERDKRIAEIEAALTLFMEDPNHYKAYEAGKAALGDGANEE